MLAVSSKKSGGSDDLMLLIVACISFVVVAIAVTSCLFDSRLQNLPRAFM